MVQGSETPPYSPTDPALAQAAQWFERLQNEDLSAEDVMSWQRWLAADPAHRAAFERYQDLWRMLDEMPAPKLPTRAELAADSRKPATAPRLLALAASLVGVALVAGWMFVWQPTSSLEMRAFETGAAEHQSTRLPDDSELSLGAKSLLVVHFAAEERRVALERGEAFFQVAKDETRPFVVRVGDATVTAIGTAFNIRRSGARAVVAVSEGSVSVKESRIPGELRVDAGEQIVLEPAAKPPVVEPVSTEVATAWREGRLEYRGEPLKYVLADVSRYSAEEISLQDAAAGELLVTGTVFESDVAAWLDSLEEILPVQVDRREGGRVVRTQQRQP